jgi:phosphoribosyl-ATP pyrophosphohydrolase
MDIIEKLTRTLESRRDADPATSYVASLYAKGLNKILEKIGEESTEVILAAKEVEGGADKAALVHEVADLWFHSLVVLVHLNVDPQEVLQALKDRSGVSGHDEKRARAPEPGN